MTKEYDFGDHEVTDRAALCFELVSEKLVEHPKVQGSEAHLAYAERAADALYALYQSAGAEMVIKEVK